LFVADLLDLLKQT